MKYNSLFYDKKIFYVQFKHHLSGIRLKMGKKLLVNKKPLSAFVDVKHRVQWYSTSILLNRNPTGTEKE